MRSVTIGIYLDGEVQRLEATLAALRAYTRMAFDLVLLPDAVDEGTKARLSAHAPDLPVLEGSQVGAPACFNRLAAFNRAEVVVFLEAGAVPGPRWLEGLLAALDADQLNGLAGPSTNFAWNEQGVMTPRGGTLPEVAATARAAEARFGKAWRSLEPLHSLSDFCYAVKREVIAAIGGADEQYGPAPCWEMDYNIRAARAGYRGVWACAAYVYRPRFSARRAREEPRLMEAGKRRYQDKFCGLRLNGARPAYEAHCRGDACEHFSPKALIQLNLPLPRPDDAAPAENQFPSVAVTAERPMVSCIMPTRDRLDFVRQSVDYFLRQDYPSRELLIVDDGNGDLSTQIQQDDRVRYLRLAPGLSIGAKRNRGCELAKGQLIAQWDDDDWYAPGRLSAQLGPLLSGTADITGLRSDLFFDLPNWKFWRVKPELHRRLFVEDIHGGTLVFTRSCWERLSKYPDCSLAEDAALLRGAMRSGGRLCRMANDGLFIYLRHGGNSWSFKCGDYLDPRGWLPAPPPAFSTGDLAFYAAHSSRAPARPDGLSGFDPANGPLVSCIMPTCDRRFLVPQSIRYFLRQDYPNRELIVVDDGSDPIEDLIPKDPRIRYLRLPRRQSLGAKRNLACEQAAGSVIMHWDDDDWMADWRLSHQVGALSSATGKSVCGLSRLLYFDPRLLHSWFYTYPAGDRRWVAGNTLCYYKHLWQQRRFAHIDAGEDTRFIWSVPESLILTLPNHEFYLGVVHDRNASPKRTQDQRWSPFPVSGIRSLIGPDFDFYENWPGGEGRRTAPV
jgi:glycosyltransferase involved in cell wall biosynthesis